MTGTQTNTTATSADRDNKAETECGGDIMVMQRD